MKPIYSQVFSLIHEIVESKILVNLAYKLETKYDIHIYENLKSKICHQQSTDV